MLARGGPSLLAVALVLETPIITDPLRIHSRVAFLLTLDVTEDDGSAMADVTFTGYAWDGTNNHAFDMDYDDEGVLTVSMDATRAAAITGSGSYEWRITEQGQEPQVFAKGKMIFAPSSFPVNG